MRKIIVAGGRDFINYTFLSDILDEWIQRDQVEIVSGRARGADSLGERYAQEKGHQLKLFPAEWNKYRNAAGPIRNEKMGEYADELVAFWDGRSSGTKHMVKFARSKNLLVGLFTY